MVRILQYMLPGSASLWLRSSHKDQVLQESPWWVFLSYLFPVHYFTCCLNLGAHREDLFWFWGLLHTVTLCFIFEEQWSPCCCLWCRRCRAAVLLACLTGTYLNCSLTGLEGRQLNLQDFSHSLTVHCEFCRGFFWSCRGKKRCQEVIVLSVSS